MVAPWANRQPNNRSSDLQQPRHPDNVRDSETSRIFSPSPIIASSATNNNVWGGMTNNSLEESYFERILTLIRETERQISSSVGSAGNTRVNRSTTNASDR